MVSASNGFRPRITVLRAPGVSTALGMISKPEVIYWARFLFGSVRLAVAIQVLLLCLMAWPNIAARTELSALPDYDYLAAADALRSEERFAEAILVINEGLDATPPALRTIRMALTALRERTEQDRLNALTGTRLAQEDAPAPHRGADAPNPAVVADLLVFKDVSGLNQQVEDLLPGRSKDAALAALNDLSADQDLPADTQWALTFLRLCRRAGTLNDSLLQSINSDAGRVLSHQNPNALRDVTHDIVDLTRSAQPGPALRIMSHIGDEVSLHLAATTAQHKGGAFALWLGGDETLAWLARIGPAGFPLIEHATRKGSAGMALLTRRGADFTQLHPVLGLIKGIYKGPVPSLLAHIFQDEAIAVLGVVLGWLLFELVSLAAHSHLHARAQAFRRQLGWME